MEPTKETNAWVQQKLGAGVSIIPVSETIIVSSIFQNDLFMFFFYFFILMC